MQRSQEEYNRICTELWEKHEKRIQQICKRKLDSYPHEIDEIISEAYLILCEGIYKDMNMENPASWLYGAVNNLVKAKYTEINNRKKHLVSLFDNNNEPIFDLPYSVDFIDNAISDEKIEEMAAEIEHALTKKEAELYELAFEKCLPYKEIAKIYNSTDTAVKQRAYRLKKKIKEIAKYNIDNYL